MKLAIYGSSCTGKTTVSNCLAKELALEVRHCGEQIKEAAVRAGSSPDALPVEQHLLLDSLTRDVVRNAKGGIVVEGAFLDYVLSDVEDCRLVKLVCLDAERIRRVVSRGSEHSIAERDASDVQLVKKLFGLRAKQPDLQIDTTTLTPSETERCITEWLHRDKIGS